MKIKRLLGSAAATFLLGCVVSAQVFSATTLKIQAAVPDKSDDFKMLQGFAEQVKALTEGEVVLEIMPAGKVVKPKEIIDAVSNGLVDGGQAWTHYWSGKHPAAMLFGAPIAGSGVGIDNFAFMSWFNNGGGKELYEEMWKEMGLNIKGMYIAIVGPEALGWFKEPISSMADFKKYRFRTPPGIPGKVYQNLGITSVPMPGGEIFPALENKLIEAAEWCCPKPDSEFGFHKVLKNYYLQGLHQVVVNSDIYFNGDKWNKLTSSQQLIIQAAADAAIMKNLTKRIYDNGVALQDIVKNHDVKLHDTPKDYFPAFMNEAKNVLEGEAKKNAFFKKVWDSQKDFAAIAVPYWAEAQTSSASLGKAYSDSLK